MKRIHWGDAMVDEFTMKVGYMQGPGTVDRGPGARTAVPRAEGPWYGQGQPRIQIGTKELRTGLFFLQLILRQLINLQQPHPAKTLLQQLPGRIPHPGK